MSSSPNNSLPPQSVALPSSSTEFANSRTNTSSTVSKSQRQQTNRDSPAPSNRGRAGRFSGRGRGRGRPSEMQTERTSDTSNDNGSSNRIVGYKAAGDGRERGRAKHHRRHQTNRLIGGMDSASGLDIDLVESLAPINSEPKSHDSKKGSGRSPNSRKVNLTHLLNNQYDRNSRIGVQKWTRSPAYGTSSSGFRQSNHSTKSFVSHYRNFGEVHKFNKQQFLQANCQFVVLNGHDYTIHKADPDWPVDWDCIEEVRFKQSACTETTCPICLEPPIAAKITKCGHIYCWTCMLHYLSLSDENCRQCPICFEYVYSSDLRSVISQSYINYSVDNEITMQLMIRRKGCVEVEPYNSRVDDINNKLSSDIDKPYSSQANLIIVNSSKAIDTIVQREKDELMMKLDTDRNEPEVCFIENALTALEKRTEKLAQTKCLRPIKQHDCTNEDYIDSKNYLFYQCCDGQHIYLNPFSTKILIHEFGSLENCPLKLKAKILQMDWVSMTETWRKRFKYLEHLPLTCEFRLIEIDFEESNIVSIDTLKIFEEQIRARKQERDRRLKEERKRERIIKAQQDRKIYGIQPSLKISLDSREQFPSVSDERYLGLSHHMILATCDSHNQIDYDSDDDIENTNQSSQPEAPLREQIEPEVVSTGDVPLPDNDTISSVTKSFKEIQLEEEAKEAKARSTTTKVVSSWGRNQTQAPSSSSSFASMPSSSFAKLLVDAKSQKEWTSNVSTSKQSNAINVVPSSEFNLNHRAPNYQVTVDEDDEEELRAPPYEFTISDFIDLNVKSGSNRKKDKKSNNKIGNNPIMNSSKN